MRRIITLIDQEHSTEGYEFVFLKEGEECRDCRLYKVCIENLEEGRKYRIKEVRPFEHQCRAYGKVNVVEVVLAGSWATMPPREAIVGASLNYSSPGCEDILCKNHILCQPEGVKEGEKVYIEKVGGKLSCPRGKELVTVKLRPQP